MVDCLDSIRSQTLKEIEIICVDDGSADSTLEILLSIAQKDKRKIVDSKSISSLGYTKIKIELYKNVIATITIHIEEEK